MFQDIHDHMKLSREERRSRLKLDEPCLEIGGYDSREYRGLLAHTLKTTIPTDRKIMLCHACNNHGCSNTNHLYWGSGKDNHLDQVLAGTYKSIYDKSLKKFGAEEWSKKLSDGGRKGGKAGAGKTRRTEDDLKRVADAIASIPEGRGRIAKLSRLLGVTHTQVRRYLEMPL
jgi:hypothetical protein